MANFESFPHDQWYEFIKRRLNNSIDDRTLKKAFEKTNPVPGFTLVSGVDQNFIKDTCVLCCQIPCFPAKCSECGLYYCQRCCYLLIVLQNIKDGKGINAVELKDFYGKKFNCLTCGVTAISQTLADNEKEDMKKKIIRCNRMDCSYNGSYMQIVQHNCSKLSNDFRISTSFMSSFTTQPEPIPMELDYCSVNLATVLDGDLDALWEKLWGLQVNENNLKRNIQDNMKITEIV